MKVKAKKLRREGYIIGNLFGKDIENSIPLKLDSHDTTMFLKDHKGSAHHPEHRRKQYRSYDQRNQL